MSSYAEPHRIAVAGRASGPSTKERQRMIIALVRYIRSKAQSGVFSSAGQNLSDDTNVTPLRSA